MYFTQIISMKKKYCQRLEHFPIFSLFEGHFSFELRDHPKLRDRDFGRCRPKLSPRIRGWLEPRPFGGRAESGVLLTVWGKLHMYNMYSNGIYNGNMW